MTVMGSTVPKSLDSIPLHNLKCALCDSESPRQKLTPPSGAMVEAAMRRAKLEPKQLADLMEVSVSFLLRGFKDQETISWQRVQRVRHRRFRRELLAVQAEELTGTVVTLNITLPPVEKAG